MICKWMEIKFKCKCYLYTVSHDKYFRRSNTAQKMKISIKDFFS